MSVTIDIFAFMKKLLSLLVLFGGTLSAQIGGNYAYQFINVVPSARVAAQGGVPIAHTDDDLNFALWNPSLLNAEMDGQVSISMVDYVSDILLGDVSYARHFDSIGTFSVGLRYLNYGDFDRTNSIGIKTGTFTGTDMALTFGYGYTIDTNWSVGANMKIINSKYDAYGSTGMAFDLGVTYQIPSKRLSFALVAKNAGFQFNPYDAQREKIPFELQVGMSNRFEHLPLRWSITYAHLEKWDLRYDDPRDVTVNLDGEVEEDPPNVMNNLLRHFVVGAEFAPTKSFNIQFGYNFRKRQELNLESRRTSAGFSFGLGLKISKFRINYARNMYHVAGGANNFSIVTNLGDFKKK